MKEKSLKKNPPKNKNLRERNNLMCVGKLCIEWNWEL